jgi:hypothetical protein
MRVPLPASNGTTMTFARASSSMESGIGPVDGSRGIDVVEGVSEVEAEPVVGPPRCGFRNVRHGHVRSVRASSEAAPG